MGHFAYYLDGLFEICDRAVSGGYLVAMVLVCALQYIYHLYQTSRAARVKEELCRQIGEVEQDLRCVSRDRTLTSLENQIIREFAKELNLDHTLDQLLTRLVSDTKNGFAAYIPLESRPWRVTRSRGISEKARKGIALDEELVDRVTHAGVLVIEGATLARCSFYNSLPEGDRRRCERLFFSAIGEKPRIAGVIVSTSLIPQGIPLDQQIDLMQRLMQSLTGIVLRARELEDRERQLRSINETMELRAVTERKHTSPLEMIEAYVDRLREMTRSQRAVLFLVAGDGGAFKALCRCGPSLAPGIAQKHAEFETILAESVSAGEEFASLQTEQLQSLGVASLIGSAIVAPVMSPSGIAGVLCLTSPSAGGFSEVRPELIHWAANYLSGTLLRALHQAVDQWHARQDPLTTLSNRRTFDQELATIVTAAEGSTGLLMIDVDRFKSVNDRYGHLTGDEVLRVVSRVLKETVASRPADSPGMAARFGGEEFAILLPDTELEQSIAFAETIRKAIESTPIATSQGQLSVTASIGVAQFPQHGHSAQHLIASADVALYQAKESGRNRVMIAKTTSSVGRSASGGGIVPIETRPR